MSAAENLWCSGGDWGRWDFRVLSGVIRWAKGVPAISRRQNSRTAEPETSPTRGPRWSPVGFDRQEDANDQDR